jgi:hypothetical protein
MSSCFLFVNDEESSSKVNIDELYEKKHQRDLKQLSIFNKILNRVHRRIEFTSRRNAKDHYVWFQVPQFIVGESLYNNSHCVAYIVSKLEENGFHVRYVHPNTLFISWEHWIPSYVRNEIKRKTGIVINERGIVIKNDSRDTDINAGLYRSDSAPVAISVAAAAATDNAEKPDKSYNSVKQYKPTGQLVYDPKLFDKIEKRVSFA